MKLFLLLIILSLIVLNFMYIKRTVLKIILGILLFLLSILLIGTTYQHYATDEINTEIINIDEYEFDEENDLFKITYTDLNNEKISKELSSDEVQIQISNGYGEVQLNERAYIKDIEIFKKYTIQLNKSFEKEEPIYIINIMNFMSEEEIDNMLESLNANN